MKVNIYDSCSEERKRSDGVKVERVKSHRNKRVAKPKEKHKRKGKGIPATATASCDYWLWFRIFINYFYFMLLSTPKVGKVQTVKRHGLHACFVFTCLYFLPHLFVFARAPALVACKVAGIFPAKHRQHGINKRRQFRDPVGHPMKAPHFFRLIPATTCSFGPFSIEIELPCAQPIEAQMMVLLPWILFFWNSLLNAVL